MAATGAESRIQEGDLSDRRFLAELSEGVRNEPRLSFLLHNAGFGVHGAVGEADPDRLQAMADVHVSATIALCSAAAVGFRQRRSGDVVVVSSIAGWLTGSGSATYCATKAFETSFARSLAQEMRPFGVRVQALCPGWTLTGFHDTPEYAHWSRSSVPKALWSTAEEVVRASWETLGRGDVCIPGRLNRLVTAVGRAIPVGRIRDRIRRSRGTGTR